MPESPTRARSGFTLVETLIVIVMAGILTMMGWPRLRDAKIRSDVRSSRSHVVALYARARSEAIETRRTTTLHFSGTSAWVTASPRLATTGSGTIDTIGAVDNLFVTYGVNVAAAPVTQVTVDPRGLGTSAATTITLSRAGVTDSVAISLFGRVQR